MYKRILYGGIAAAIVLFFLLFQTFGMVCLVVSVGCGAIYEFNNALNHGGFPSNPFFGYAFMVLLAPVYFLFEFEGLLLLFAICFFLNFGYYVIRKQITTTMICSNIQLIYPCLLIGFACPILFNHKVPGYTMLILLMMCCFGCDIFAYFTGTLFGKHKLCPEISPKKTIEGAVGGLLGSIICAFIFQFIISPTFLATDLGLPFVITAGLFCGIFAQLGDLSASLVKRVCNIKDFGDIIPGHGGILDRLDSIIFCIPVLYFLMLIFYFGG